MCLASIFVWPFLPVEFSLGRFIFSPSIPYLELCRAHGRHIRLSRIPFTTVRLIFTTMRLLELENGEFSLIKLGGNNIPEYAILSHTWGTDGEEVTFKDLMKGTGKGKPGYEKIRFCAKQTDLDGLKYFWVDTCCINKADFTELAEAINSMFRWYREAARCYVYLSDVPDSKDPKSTIESAFRESRWFKRGWTLQELIAPTSVQFFSRDGELLGDKKLREQQIHQITGIAIEALQGYPLSQFSIAERLLWAARRETKVEEDAAYCQLGIFDIHMPLIYGEGRNKALDRLLRKIQKSSNARSLLPTDARWIMPFRNNTHITGHESQLAQHNEKLFAQDHISKMAITGIGRTGKEQLFPEQMYERLKAVLGQILMLFDTDNHRQPK
jgi:hypothetical protein